MITAEQREEIRDVEYRPIAGYPGYRVGNDGSVWSSWRHTRGVRGEWEISDVWRRIGGINSKGRMSCSLMRGGVKKEFTVAKLVLSAFVGPCPVGMECCHGPLGQTVDRLENLRWDTHSENMLDRARHEGRNDKSIKLTWRDVCEIRKRFGSQNSRTLAKEFGVSHWTIFDVAKFRSWRGA